MPENSRKNHKTTKMLLTFFAVIYLMKIVMTEASSYKLTNNNKIG